MSVLWAGVFAGYARSVEGLLPGQRNSWPMQSKNWRDFALPCRAAGGTKSAMRIAVVSDIHGNLPALDAVIADMRAQGIARVFNLGDSLSGPLWPVETAERLIALGWPSLAGNHERQLLTLPMADMGLTDAATAAVLPQWAMDWMRALPSTLTLENGLLLCHATPGSDHTYWLHKGRRGTMREATMHEIERDATDHALTLCGHTHLPRHVVLANGRQIANPGSVGLPAYEDDLPTYHVVETGDPLARYLIAEYGAAGWSVALRAVSYDYEMAARRAERAGRANWAHALRTGRVMGR